MTEAVVQLDKGLEGYAESQSRQDWLGHGCIQHTVRYTELSPARFKNFWR